MLSEAEIQQGFWGRVSVGAPDDCWEWKLSVGSHGYGQWWPNRRTSIPTKNHLVHRLAWVFTHGEIPDRLTVDHMCRNRRCCNPNHLQLLTNEQNAAQAKKRVTHCPQGHEYDLPNTYVHPRTGHRQCRACMKRWRR